MEDYEPMPLKPVEAVKCVKCRIPTVSPVYLNADNSPTSRPRCRDCYEKAIAGAGRQLVVGPKHRTLPNYGAKHSDEYGRNADRRFGEGFAMMADEFDDYGEPIL